MYLSKKKYQVEKKKEKKDLEAYVSTSIFLKLRLENNYKLKIQTARLLSNKLKKDSLKN